MHKPALAPLVYATLFPRGAASASGDSSCPDFSSFVASFLVPEVRHETIRFHGHLSSLEAQYPGLDYADAHHRRRLSQYPYHRRLFRALDALRCTPHEIRDLCRWEGTQAARERFEREQRHGVPVRDTTWDGIAVAPPRRASPRAFPAALYDALHNPHPQKPSSSCKTGPHRVQSDPRGRLRTTTWQDRERLHGRIHDDIMAQVDAEVQRRLERMYRSGNPTRASDLSSDEDEPMPSAGLGEDDEKEADNEHLEESAEEGDEEEETDPVQQSVGQDLNRRLLAASAARARGEQATIDPAWEQWMKEAAELASHPLDRPPVIFRYNPNTTDVRQEALDWTGYVLHGIVPDNGIVPLAQPVPSLEAMPSPSSSSVYSTSLASPTSSHHPRTRAATTTSYANLIGNQHPPAAPTSAPWNMSHSSQPLRSAPPTTTVYPMAYHSATTSTFPASPTSSSIPRPHSMVLPSAVHRRHHSTSTVPIHPGITAAMSANSVHGVNPAISGRIQTVGTSPAQHQHHRSSYAIRTTTASSMVNIAPHFSTSHPSSLQSSAGNGNENGSGFGSSIGNGVSTLAGNGTGTGTGTGTGNALATELASTAATLAHIADLQARVRAATAAALPGTEMARATPEALTALPPPPSTASFRQTP